MNYSEQYDMLKSIHQSLNNETGTITRDHSSLNKRKKLVSDLKQYRYLVEATLKGLLLYIDGAIEKGEYCIGIIEGQHVKAP